MAGRAPIRKVRAGAAGGGALAVLVGLIDILTGLRLDTEVIAALVGALVTFGTAYVTPSAPGEPTAPGRGVPLPRSE